MTLFRNKYRVESARLKGFDYSLPGEYFVTIDTKGMVHPVRYSISLVDGQIHTTISRGEWFGKVEHGQMVRNDVGEIAHQLWLDIPSLHQGVILDDFVVMPNHVHGIIGLTEVGSNRRVVCRDNHNDVIGRDANIRVSTGDNIKQHGGATGADNPMLSHHSLSFIVRSYKGRVSFEIHKRYPDFSWQARFHDHVVRSPKELDRIRKYILENPGRWEEDKTSPSATEEWMD